MGSIPKPSGLCAFIRHLTRAVALTFALSANEVLAADTPSQPATHKTTSSVSYIIVDPMYATILDGGKPRGLLMVEFGLDVPDAAFRGQVNHALPVLRDAYVRNLMAFAASTVRVYRQPNVEDIANRMQTITDKVMGKKGAQVLMAQTALRITR